MIVLVATGSAAPSGHGSDPNGTRGARRGMRPRSPAQSRLSVLLLALSLAMLVPASAQVSGVVLDTSFDPVPGARVSLRATAERATT
jgi:hypothetical protein